MPEPPIHNGNPISSFKTHALTIIVLIYDRSEAFAAISKDDKL